MTSRTKLKRKEVDDVLGGDDQWKHADSTHGKRMVEHDSPTLLLTLSRSDMSEMRQWACILLSVADKVCG